MLANGDRRRWAAERDGLVCSSLQAASSEATSFFRFSMMSSISLSSAMSIFSYCDCDGQGGGAMVAGQQGRDGAAALRVGPGHGAQRACRGK